ncbi:MAG: 6-phosphofructokinase [Bacteroidales bacterium]|jgi:6-phosphofructokinase 1|nr:6-phosphofructokinase [Bacteroidales bacterium]
MKIGILSAGGDCPGINATIRGVGKAAITYGMEVTGILDGFSGLLFNDYLQLDERSLSGILTLGGTILGTSREKPFKKQEGDVISDKPQLIKENYEKAGFDCIVCIGGNGTQKTAAQLSEIGLNVIGIPKTIDNDVWGTDITFGFDTAVNIATEAIDRLHSTANSHKRVMVIELMGHHAGWIALYAGLAGGGDVILIPEIPYEMDHVNEELMERSRKGKPYSIVVVAEGIKAGKKEDIPAGACIAQQIEKKTRLETRVTVPGYTLRGGTPSPLDRVIATRMGTYAASLLHKREFGRMVAIRNNEMIAVPLKEVGGKMRLVPPDYFLIKQAKRIGTCFG